MPEIRITIGHVDVQSCLLINSQYKPISLQYCWLSVEQPIRIDWVYKHHWEVPINKKIIPTLSCPITMTLLSWWNWDSKVIKYQKNHNFLSTNPYRVVSGISPDHYQQILCQAITCNKHDVLLLQWFCIRWQITNLSLYIFILLHQNQANKTLWLDLCQHPVHLPHPIKLLSYMPQ